MYLTLHDVAKFLICILAFAVIACVARVGIDDGWLPTSEQKPQGLSVPSSFMIEVQDDGTAILRGVKNAPKRLHNMVGNSYSSPDAAEHAISSETPEEVSPLPNWLISALDFFGIKPAEAHAVDICTHSDGKVSNQTGAGRHITKFRFHRDGRHYTRTDHQVLTQYGYQTYDVFYYDVSRSYCGCN